MRWLVEHSLSIRAVAACVAGLGLLLAGCGQKGPLYLPAAPAAAASAASAGTR